MAIELAGALWCLVDASDYPRLRPLRWRALRTKGGPTYAVTGRKSLLMHRVVMGLSVGDPDIDHRNLDGLDNRRINLRAATDSENGCNRTRQRNNSTGFKGVSYRKEPGLRARYRVKIGVRGRYHELGYYMTAEEAARVYDRAAREFHGPFARLNFPEIYDS